MIKLLKKNELYIEIQCDKSIQREIQDKFTFQVPGFQYTPRYKNGLWDGTIKLYNLKQNNFPIGLLIPLYKLAKNNGWPINVDKSLKLISFENELEKFQDIVFPDLLLEPYDYQVETFIKSIMLNRSLVLSPTGSR